MNIIMFKFVSKKMWVWELVVIIALIVFLSSCSTNALAVQLDPTRDPRAEFNNSLVRHLN